MAAAPQLIQTPLPCDRCCQIREDSPGPSLISKMLVMISLKPIGIGADPGLLESVRALFTRYGDFLRLSGGHEAFRFDRFEQEIRDLPAAYTTDNGEVLVAIEESAVAGCIAYRAFPGSRDPSCCEIKRLFVAPEFRGLGIGIRLITVALDRARSKGYRLARLDTDPSTMPAAHQIYLEAGFVEYERQNSDGGAGLIFLQRSLV